VEAIYKMGVRISTIARRLLGYARPSEELEDLSVSDLIEEALGLMAGHQALRNIRLERDYQGSPMVTGVSSQLQQVFVNLISNALDATPSEGTVTLGCVAEDSKAIAYVRDTGPGISPDQRDRVFDPFFTTKDVGKGTGLGLFICHKIVTSHDGEITLESGERSGTVARVRLPLAAPPDEADKGDVLDQDREVLVESGNRRG
jgi:signal transduction histidine kinase